MLVILLIRNDAAGALGMLQGGEVGVAWQLKSIESHGGKVHHQWAVLGAYDAIVVAEFDALENAMAFSLASTAWGQYVEVMPAISHEGFQAATDIAIQAQKALTDLASNHVNNEQNVS